MHPSGLFLLENNSSPRTNYPLPQVQHKNKINLFTLTVFNKFYFFCHYVPRKYWSQHVFLCILWVQDTVLLFNIIFLSSANNCHHFHICSFISFLFVEMLLSMTLALKVHLCKFENLHICFISSKNNTLKYSHS